MRLSRADSPDRKTAFTLELMRVGRVWVSVNTGITNTLAETIIRSDLVPPLGNSWSVLKREVRRGDSRIDIVLSGKTGRTWIEVKSVTLCTAGRAAFPDAVTSRGLKHLENLRDAVARGDRAVMFYLAQRFDAAWFEPAREIDPAYARGVSRAKKGGVEIIAAKVSVGPRTVRWGGLLPLSKPVNGIS